MTKDEAVRELFRLLPSLLGRDVVIVERSTFDEIKCDLGSLADRVSIAEGNANAITYAVDELDNQLRNIQSYAEDLQDLGDLETDIRAFQTMLDEL